MGKKIGSFEKWRNKTHCVRRPYSFSGRIKVPPDIPPTDQECNSKVNLNISFADMIRKFCADLALQLVNISFHIHMWLQFCKIGKFRTCISNMSNKNGLKVPWVNSGRASLKLKGVIDLLANRKKENRWEAKDHGRPKTKSKEVLANGKMAALRKLLDPKIGMFIS
ncbi:hypothetical protein E3N88_00854 [Mikania micrantha]|uniref:Uncharacterized protein n=1 Tax=Mikania micrantha TaxID=192012 RepID=A0A5N6Q1L8_9ASTR|nr:hypothetical protein E3N88_00854 [Mikania micrantha]